MKKPPLLRRAQLTCAIYVVTRYKDRPDGGIEASEKFDVTDDFLQLVSTMNEDERRAVREIKKARKALI